MAPPNKSSPQAKYKRRRDPRSGHIMPRARAKRRVPRRTKRGKRRVKRPYGPQPLRGPQMGPQMGPQVGGNFLFKLLGTVAKTLDALT